MAGGIKGITVKIGGDTTELGRSLSSATKQSTALQKELKVLIHYSNLILVTSHF